MHQNEELLVKLLGDLAAKYKTELVLKGGMLLRLLNSSRSTQDLDYFWIRSKKRTVFAEDLKIFLETLEGIAVSDVQINSRGIFLEILHRPTGQKAKIEVSVETSPPSKKPKPLSTVLLAKLYSLPPQIVSTMDLSEAFAHKIAAALERNLARDLYDISQLELLTSFDEGTLRKRLDHLAVARAKPRRVEINEAMEMLTNKMATMTEKRMREELAATIPENHLPGLDFIIRAAVSRLIQKMAVLR